MIGCNPDLWEKIFYGPYKKFRFKQWVLEGFKAIREEKVKATIGV